MFKVSNKYDFFYCWIWIGNCLQGHTYWKSVFVDAKLHYKGLYFEAIFHDITGHFQSSKGEEVIRID